MSKGKKGFQPGNTDGIGTRFTALNQPKNRGRKNRFISILKKQCGIELDPGVIAEFSKEQILDMLKLILAMDPRDTALLNYKLSKELKAMKIAMSANGKIQAVDKNSKICQVFVILNTAISNETNKGRADTIKWIIEYLYGRSTQPIEEEISTSTNIDLDLTNLTTDELSQLNRLLEKADKVSRFDSGSQTVLSYGRIYR